MSATYSTFDTLTIDLVGGGDGTASQGYRSQLPVLAVVPTIHVEGEPESAPDPGAAQEDVQRHYEDAHTSVPAPRFEQPARHPEPPVQADPPTRVESFQAKKQLTPDVHQLVDEPIDQAFDWEESSWATWMLELESTLRPHARLIVLVVLVALTGLTLVVLRSPVQPPIDTSSDAIVDTSGNSLTSQVQESSTQVAQGAPHQDTVQQVDTLEPIPEMLGHSKESRSQFSAMGPRSAPFPAGWTPDSAQREGLDPIPVKQVASPPDAVAAGPGAAADPSVRVAERPAYPRTSTPAASWNAEPDLPRQPPVAELMPLVPSQPGQE